VLQASGATTEVVVTAPDEVDILTAPALTDRLMRACASHPARVVVDFGSTTFCDSTSIEALLKTAACSREHGCELEIRSPNVHLRRMAAVLGLSDELGIPA
jgi:anti-anti-sigma factor